MESQATGLPTSGSVTPSVIHSLLMFFWGTSNVGLVIHAIVSTVSTLPKALNQLKFMDKIA